MTRVSLNYNKSYLLKVRRDLGKVRMKGGKERTFMLFVFYSCYLIKIFSVLAYFKAYTCISYYKIKLGSPIPQFLGLFVAHIC